MCLECSKLKKMHNKIIHYTQLYTFHYCITVLADNSDVFSRAIYHHIVEASISIIYCKGL